MAPDRSRTGRSSTTGSDGRVGSDRVVLLVSEMEFDTAAPFADQPMTVGGTVASVGGRLGGRIG